MSSYFFILIHNFNKFSTYNVTVAWNHNQYKDLIFNKEGATFEETYIYFTCIIFKVAEGCGIEHSGDL